LIVAHEDRAVCWSQRSEGSLGAFCCERDGDYTDRVFAFANSVLSLLKQQSRRRYAANGFASRKHQQCRTIAQGAGCFAGTPTRTGAKSD
jgi:hypothetical protein